MKGRAKAIAIALVVAVVAMVVRFPGALPGPRVVSAHDHLSVHPLFQEDGETGRVAHPHLSDPALQFAALDKRTVAALRRGEAPLWNPDIYLGAPLLGDAQSRPLSPVTLLKVPPWRPSVAQDLGVAWLLTWSALGWGLLCGRLARREDVRSLAVATGAAVGLTTPFLSVWLLHPHASTVVWLPWGLLALEANAGVGLALATFGLLTGGHPGTMVHVGAIWAVWWALRSRRVILLVGLLAGTLLAAPVWMPVVEQAARSTTMTARVGGTLPSRQLVDLLWPGVLGHPARETWQGTGAWADGQLHPGLMAMGLAVWGLGHPKTRRGPSSWAWAVVFACGIGAVVGLPGPFAHGRLLSLGVGLLAIPAALGVGRLPGGRWRLALPLLVLATGTHARWDDQHTVEQAVHEVEPARWAAPLLDAAEGGRVLGLDWALQPNTGALAGLRDVRGYDLPVSTDTHRLMEALNRPPRGPWYPVEQVPPGFLQRFLGIRVVAALADQVARLPEAGWERLDLPEPAPLVASRDRVDNPMAWVAGTSIKRSSPEASLGWAMGIKNAMGWLPVEVDLDAAGQEASIAPATRTEHGGSVIALSFEAADHPRVAVASEAWAPGWRARLSDGSPVPVVRVAGLILGAPIPPGADGVRFYYRPEGWIVGQRLFLGGLVLLVGLLIHRNRMGVRPPGITFYGGRRSRARS